jgi:group I intron endonuclease
VANEKPSIESVVGIYKITSPSGRIYIGQSWDIKSRLASYRAGRTHKQPKLHASFQKYGPSAHEYEVMMECEGVVTQADLDFYEVALIGFYRRHGARLMNVRDGGSRGKHSVESKRKMSVSLKGKSTGRAPWNKGRTGVYSDETIRRIKEGRARQPKLVYTDSMRAGMAIAARRRGITQEVRKRMVEVKLRKYHDGLISWPGTKLTPEIVRAIRSKHVPRVYGCVRLAKEYGVSKSLIKGIVAGKAWKHVNVS